MEGLAEMIVKKARSVPTNTAIALTGNKARIAKVAVTGGLGLEVTYEGKKLLFPMAEAKSAVESFMIGAHKSREDINRKFDLELCYENGIPATTCEWNCVKSRAKAEGSIHRILKNPPLSGEMETETASIPFDARNRDGWDVESMPSMVPVMTESTDESENEDEEEI